MSPLRLLQVFGRAPGARPIATVACLFAAGVFDVLGMSMVIPFVGSLSKGGRSGTTRLGALGQGVLDFVHAPHATGVILLFIAGLLCVKSALVFGAMTFVASSVAQVGQKLRRNLLDALLRADLHFFTDQHPGRIANALVNEADGATSAFSQSALVVAECLKLAGILLIAALVSGWLLFAALLIAVTVAYALSLVVRFRKLAFHGQNRVSGELFRKTQDAFANIKALKGMERAAPYRRILDDGIASLKTSVLVGQATRHGVNASQDILLALALCGGIYACVTWLGMAVAELIILATLFLFMSKSLEKLQVLLQAFREALPAYEVCEQLLEDAQSHAEPDAGRREPRLQDKIVFDNVTFSYGAKVILEAACFEISAGAITVLEGGSGAGKTTTIDLIIGFHAPQSGRVLIDGVPLGDISSGSWRSMIGYAPQDLALIEGSIFENLVLGDARIGRDAAWEALELAAAGDFVRSLPQGLDTPVGALGGKLSGGQRQRISLARALVCKPRLLLLDEVTSALDLKTEQQICSNLAKLTPAVTIVAITHRPAWARIASAILRFDARGVRLLSSSERLAARADEGLPPRAVAPGRAARPGG